MTRKVVVWLAALGVAGTAGTAGAQGMMQGDMMQNGGTHGGMMRDGIERGTAGQGTGGTGGEKSDRGVQCMMHGGMGSGTTGHRMGGMMGGGMMGGGMMGSGMMGGANSGMGALFGQRVRPVVNLSVDDVRGYLAMRLEHLNNKRLKVGEVKSDDATITADIVTLENSLVQRLKVDRHTGAITYEG